MKTSAGQEKGQLTKLVRRAEAGDEMILARHDHEAVRLIPIKPASDFLSRGALLKAVRASAAAQFTAGASAARSQDFLYGKDDLPV